MPLYPFNPNLDHRLQGSSAAVPTLSERYVAHYSKSPAAAATTTVHAAVTDNGSPQTITTLITSPAVCRNVTATAGGTAGDVKAISVVVTGTNLAGAVISETLPAFTVNTLGTVTGTKCFKTVTSILIPAHDGVGATTAIGTGSKLGLHHELDHNTVLFAFLNNVKEGTAPTVTTDDNELEKNGFTLNSAIPGSQPVDVYYLV